MDHANWLSRLMQAHRAPLVRSRAQVLIQNVDTEEPMKLVDLMIDITLIAAVLLCTVASVVF